MAWLGLDGLPKGIQHVVEIPNLLRLLRTWASADGNAKKKAEQRVIKKFVEDTKVLTIPLSATMRRKEREEMREMVRKWNSKHTTKCEYLQIHMDGSTLCHQIHQNRHPRHND